MNKPLKINNIIGRSALSRLLARVHALEQLEHQLQDQLPQSLRPHCHVLAVQGRTLVLAADSPVWAARLRFHTPQLQRRLATSAGLDSIRVRVRPPLRPDTLPPRRAPGPRSRQTIETLRRAALTVSDPALKTALMKLADNGPARRGRD